MLGKKARLQQIIDFQEKRFEDLKFSICQGDHDFAEIGSKTSFDWCGGYVESRTTKRYKCRKCGKVIIKSDY